MTRTAAVIDGLLTEKGMTATERQNWQRTIEDNIPEREYENRVLRKLYRRAEEFRGDSILMSENLAALENEAASRETQRVLNEMNATVKSLPAPKS